MTHVDLEKIWATLSIFMSVTETKHCYPNGLDSLRIVYINFRGDEREIIFTYNSETEWSIETVGSFIRRGLTVTGIDLSSGTDMTGNIKPSRDKN